MSQPNNSGSGHVWYNWHGSGCQANHILSPDQFAVERPYDVAIIGAGVVGCAIAYELSQYQLRTIVIDQRYDVGEGTSKANSAIVHTGFDATPDSLESQLVSRASRQWPDLAQKLKIPFSQVSALMLAMNDEQLRQLPKLKEKAFQNGVDDVQLVSAEEAKRLEPHINPSVLGGLLVPRESIADPFTTSIAYADVAIANGVDLALGVEVLRVEDADSPIKSMVAAGQLRIFTRYIVNASGFGCRSLVESYHGELMDLNPRRGQFVIYDRDCTPLVGRILLPIPTEQTKGMLITPTIFGNLVAGPTAEDLPAGDVKATNTTFEGLEAVRRSSIEMCPALANQPVIATYAGLRCNCAQGSYWMRFNDGHAGIVTLAGIRSTGFTSSIATAQLVIERMSHECGLKLQKNPSATDHRSEAKWPGWWRRPYQDPQRMASNPDYGRIVCSCEQISRGEIQDALDSSAGTATLDGLKRRTRVLTGRCQGFNCCVPVAQMISRQFNVPLGSVTKCGPGSEFIADRRSKSVVPARTVAVAGASFRPRYQVIIVGGGPAGIGTAIGLAKRGIDDVLLIERASELGGIPAKYKAKDGGVRTFVAWQRGRVMFGQDYVKWITSGLSRTRAQISLESQVTTVCQHEKIVTVVSPQGQMKLEADAVVFACGARERTVSERGWIAGHRPARVFNTMQLLQLLDACEVTPLQRPAIVGSDLIAFAAAAKLQAAGVKSVTLLDQRPRPAAGMLARLYFRRWSDPTWHSTDNGVLMPPDFDDGTDGPSTQALAEIAEADHFQRHDGLFVCGELLPNSELAVAAGLQVSQPDRVPEVRHHELSRPGWFMAGAEQGGFRSAHWCYRDGFRAASKVAEYLRHLPGRCSQK